MLSTTTTTKYNSVHEFLTKNPPPDMCAKREFLLHIDRCNAKDLPDDSIIERTRAKIKVWETWKTQNTFNIIRELKLNKDVTADGTYLIHTRDKHGNISGITASHNHPNLMLVADLLANPFMTVKNAHLVPCKTKEVKESKECKAKKYKRPKVDSSSTHNPIEVNSFSDYEDDNDSD
jgi:hypothetical protein